ncbi:MAG: hypothetical protein AB1656_15235 [Candidatus Omnitrophota bacterium]
MKKYLLVLVIFIIGLVCGISLDRYWGTPSGTGKAAAVEDKKDGQGDQTANAPVPVMPANLSALLFEKTLPNASPCWLLLDMETLRAEGDVFSAIGQEEIFSQIGGQFASALLPHGVTAAVSAIGAHAEQVRLFMLPSEGNAPVSSIAAAAKILKGTEEGSPLPKIIETLIAAFPGAATSEMPAGAAKMQVISVPFGEIAILADSGIVWISNQKDALMKLWTTPPPPELAEKSDPYSPYKKRFENSGAALFFNAAKQEGPSLGPPGTFPMFLKASGVREAVCLYQLQEGAGRLTILAPADSLPPWAEAWKPLEQFLFTPADPPGMIEFAMRWPEIVSATAAVAASSGPAAAEPSASGEEMAPGRPTMPAGMEVQISNRRGNRDGRLKEMMASGTPPIDKIANMGSNRGESKRPLAVQAQWQMLSQWFPAGKEIGFNLFGFVNGTPTMAMAFPELDPQKSFLSQFSKMPFVQTSEIELAMLPGKRFQIGDNPMPPMLPLNNLYAVERDGITYVFDAEEAAKNYLGEAASDPAGAARRSKEMRLLLKDVRSPAQIQTVISSDFFLYILKQEEDRLPGDEESKKDFSALTTAAADLVKPMALSAGVQEKEWFLETYAAPELSHLVDSVLLGLAVYRFMGY